MASPIRPYPPTTTYQTPTLTYKAIVLLFRFVLKVFYSNVVVEGQEFLTEDGINCMLCSNHVNSLTDALLLVTTVSRRKMLRLTAKATQFNRKTFTSWLIGSSGALPIERPKDYHGRPIDNAVVFKTLIKALQEGDAVLIFPEGKSWYYPNLAPMKQGVARIVSEVLSQQKEKPNFELAIQTCSITYLHRNLFRSDVLVTFHPPIILTPSTHPELLSSANQPASETAIRELTANIATKIQSGIHGKSWDVIRLGHTARRLYAPLGTSLSLGEYVRLTQTFIEAFTEEDKEVQRLMEDLKVYQDLLYLHGIKDDRVRNPRMLRRRTLIKRLFVRIAGATFFSIICLPGFVSMWGPIFLVTKIQSEKQKRTGPIFDTYDEVAQTKLVYGFAMGAALYVFYLVIFLPLLPLAIVLLPIFFWLSLRWIEDLVSSLRASLALFRLLSLGKRQLLLLREMREGLRERVERIAVQEGLPRDSTELVMKVPRWKRAMHAGFFSVRTRRKKDWNEVLRLYDQTEYPIDDTPEELHN